MSNHSRRYAMAMLATAGCLLTGAADAAEQRDPKPSYISLGEFTINLPQRGDKGLSYAVLDITLDAAPAAASRLRDITPRLKEVVLRRLLSLADKGELKPEQTDPEVLKTVLLNSINQLDPGGIRDVLITRLLYG